MSVIHPFISKMCCEKATNTGGCQYHANCSCVTCDKNGLCVLCNYCLIVNYTALLNSAIELGACTLSSFFSDDIVIHELIHGPFYVWSMTRDFCKRVSHEASSGESAKPRSEAPNHLGSVQNVLRRFNCCIILPAVPSDQRKRQAYVSALHC